MRFRLIRRAEPAKSLSLARVIALCGLVATLALESGSAAAPESSPSPGTSLLTREGETPGTTGRGYAPAVSADGRFVAFWDGLVLLVRELQTGRTVVASRASGPDGLEDRQPGRRFGPPAISADGRYVAFESQGQNLVANDGDEADVFVRDLVSETTTLVSRASGVDGPPGNRGSFEPSISGDGRFVAFASRASNLAPNDAEPEPADPRVDVGQDADVFVRDLESGTTTLVSRVSGALGADGNGMSASPSISGDGRFVAFRSFATNLHGGDHEWGDIYLRDLQTATTIFVGRGPARSRKQGLLEEVGRPVISSDGQSVAFSTLVHFDVKPVDLWQHWLFLWKLQKRTTTLVAKGESVSPSLSRDGRYVAFSSYASNLQPYHTTRFPDIFVRDLKTGRTALVSRAANRVGTPGNGGSHTPSISADGRFVAFESRASNLHPGDGDHSGDVFLRDLGPPPLQAPAPAFCAGRRATTIVLLGSTPFGGTNADDVVVGSRASDHIAGGSGRDRLCGWGGADRLTGGSGRDRIVAGPGRDVVKSADNSPDRVDCGPGSDRAVIDSLDRVRRCGRVRVRAPRVLR